MRSELIECVLDLVAEIPPGRASSYGRIAVEARLRCGYGSARQVGQIMANHGGEVAWWRVVTASGAPADRIAAEAVRRLRAEGTPLRGERVDLGVAQHRFVLPGWTDGPTDA